MLGLENGREPRFNSPSPFESLFLWRGGCFEFPSHEQNMIVVPIHVRFPLASVKQKYHLRVSGQTQAEFAIPYFVACFSQAISAARVSGLAMPKKAMRLPGM